MYQSGGRIFGAGDHIGPVVDLADRRTDRQDRAEVIKHFKLLWGEKWSECLKKGVGATQLTPNTHTHTHTALPLSQA